MLSVLPDYIRLPDSYPLFKSSAHNNRLPTNKNERMVNDYFASMEVNRSAHRMLSVLNGDHGVHRLTADMIVQLKALLRPVTDFIGDRMIPDIYEIADFYPEYYEIGRGYGNFLSYGCFCGYREQGSLYLPPLVTAGSGVKPLDPSLIAVKTAQYLTGAPRYDHLPFEVGSLARQWLSGNYRRGISTMDRLIAGVLESRKIASVLAVLLDAMIPCHISASRLIPPSASGIGLIDTAEGALGHRIVIDDGRISSWRIISPSA